MRIILFGSHGLLGSEFQRLLSSSQHEIISFNHHDLDITDHVMTAKKISELQPEFLINATGYTNVDKAETEQEQAFEINAYAVENLAKISKEYNIPLLHFSTDYVFQGDEEQYVENAQTYPLNAYGKSKALGEELLMKNTPSYFLVRTSWLFGSGGKNFVSTILELAKKEPVLKIVNDQFGKPTYAVDLAKACLRFLNSKEYGIYHIVNEEVTNWYKYAKTIVQFSKIEKEVIPITTEQLNRPAKRPKNSILFNSKLPLLRPWPEALKEYLSTL